MMTVWEGGEEETISASIELESRHVLAPSREKFNFTERSRYEKAMRGRWEFESLSSGYSFLFSFFFSFFLTQPS